MKFLFIVLLIIIILIILPLPLKISIYFSQENYYIKLFNFFTIRNKKTKTVTDTPISSQKKSSPKKEKDKLKIKIPYIKIIKKINNIKFKPTLRIKGTIDYSLNDSSQTAIAYGLLHSFIPIIYKSINTFLKIKKYKININPIFKDRFFYEIKFNCIFFISIGQIINMFFIIIKLIIMEKGKEYE